jgi:hypothetical protein
MRLLALALLVATPTIAEAQTYYVNIYNNAPSSIVAFAQAPAGTGAFRAIVLAHHPVRGGGDSATVAFRKDDGGCLRDFKTTFADGRVLLLKGYNVCRMPVYRTGPVLARAMRETAAMRASEAAARDAPR